MPVMRKIFTGFWCKNFTPSCQECLLVEIVFVLGKQEKEKPRNAANKSQDSKQSSREVFDVQEEQISCWLK